MGNYIYSKKEKEEYIEYKLKYTLEERKIQFQNLKLKEDQVPIIIEKLKIIKDKNKKSLLIKKIMRTTDTIGLLHSIIAKRILTEEGDDGYFFLLAEKKTIHSDEMIGDIYDKYKDKDGFLYLQYFPELMLG